MERETGFESATSTLARSHSTTELFPPERPKYHTAGPDSTDRRAICTLEKLRRTFGKGSALTARACGVPPLWRDLGTDDHPKRLWPARPEPDRLRRRRVAFRLRRTDPLGEPE